MIIAQVPHLDTFSVLEKVPTGEVRILRIRDLPRPCSLARLTEELSKLHKPVVSWVNIDATCITDFREAQMFGQMSMTLPACTLWATIDFGKHLTQEEGEMLLGLMQAQHRDVKLYLHPPP